MGSAWWLAGLVILVALLSAVVWAGAAWGRERRGLTVDSLDEGTAEAPPDLPATLDELERQTRVPLEDQVVELPGEPAPGLGTDWEIEQRRWLKTEGIGN